MATQALRYGAQLAAAARAQVVLVRVVRDTGAPEERARAAEEAHEHLSGVAEWLSGRGIGVEVAVPLAERAARAADAVASAILEEASRQEADLVVMSTHGRSGLGRLVYGSVAERVLARSTSPVMLVRSWRPDADLHDLSRSPRLLVPLDGSPFAEEALPVARNLADLLGGELLLVRSVFPASAPLVDQWMAASYVAEELAVREDEAREYLASVARRLAREGREAETQVRVGLPAE